MTENRGQRTEDRKQRSEVRGQRSDNRGQIFEVGSRTRRRLIDQDYAAAKDAEVGIIRNTEVEKAMDRIEHGAWGRAFCAVPVF
jgi:hypothetical protein